MSTEHGHFAARKMRLPFSQIAVLVALVTLLAWRLPAQNIIINTADFTNLQQAVNYNGTTTRVIACQFNGTITVTTPLFITGNILLYAPTNYNVTIAGSAGVRIFQVLSNNTFTIENLVISGGNSVGTNGFAGAAGATGGFDGGAGTTGTSGGQGSGGAIYNAGTNIAINCVFLTNNATGGVGGVGGPGGNGNVGQGGNGGSGGNGGNGGPALGGAILNLGMLVVSNCTFGGNGAVGGVGGLGGTNGLGNGAYPGGGGSGGVAEGAAIYNLGRANIQASTFDFNFVEGGVSQTAGTSSQLTGLPGQIGGSALGGGICNVETNGISNNVVIINCTFAGNLAIGGAGGNGGQANPNGYRAGAGGNGGTGSGGGLYNAPGGMLFVTNCTFANGSVFGGTNGVAGSVGTPNINGTVGLQQGGNLANNGATFRLQNSIVAYPTNGYNIYGQLTDGGFNIISDNTPPIIASTTRTNTDPLLLPLGTNGGLTLTFDLQPQLSPALHFITNGIFPPFDQRGFPRTGPDADAGSVESGIPTFVLGGQIFPIGNFYTNVLIDVTGASGGLTYTINPNANGAYSFSNTLPADTYTIVPQGTNGFSFNPIFETVTLAVTNPVSTNNDFEATASYMIGGVISNLTSITPTATVVIYATTNGGNTQFETTVTSNFGLYTFTNVPVGNFTIVPQVTTSVAFNPPSLLVTVTGNNTNNNFFAVLPTYSVSGQITGGTGPFTVYANIGSSSTLFASTQTDSSGNYSFANLTAGAYTFVPQPTNGFSFTPIDISLTVPPNTNNQNFTASGTASFTIMGQITNLHSVVNVSATSSSTNMTVASDSNGNFAFTSLPAGNYTLTAGPMTGLTFQPVSMAVQLPPSTNNQFFAAVPSAHPTNSAPHFGNQTFDFSVGGFPYLTYRVQASTNLKTWADISTNTTGASGSVIISNSTAGFTNRFFRVVTP